MRRCAAAGGMVPAIDRVRRTTVCRRDADGVHVDALPQSVKGCSRRQGSGKLLRVRRKGRQFGVLVALAKDYDIPAQGVIAVVDNFLNAFDRSV
jgi:hypothetical protein